LVAEVKSERFSLIANRDGAVVAARLTGSADHTHAADLTRAFDAIHTEARHGVDVVVLDMRELEFMSSAGLKAILSWIADLQELPPAARYQIRFVSDPVHYRWQKRSLNTVRMFATDLISITEA
jgi:anti-anti-sigma factor